ncbi:MAG: GNAT family N-acetyltransferase [Tissierellia bacterium]|nr:GNAT family N-acetyltransferase [Tissierellia bacterium]
MITLNTITWDNWQACLRLKVTEEQDDFIASNMFILAQSYVALLNDDLPPMTFAINDGDKVIGFLMMGYDSREESEFDEASYSVVRFMIDKSEQGKGYGKKAFHKTLEYIKTFPQGEATAVYLSYDPKNDVAKKMYADFGFIETGYEDEGEVYARLGL